jgi:hypothetical protein
MGDTPFGDIGNTPFGHIGNTLFGHIGNTLGMANLVSRGTRGPKPTAISQPKAA